MQNQLMFKQRGVNIFEEHTLSKLRYIMKTESVYSYKMFVPT